MPDNIAITAGTGTTVSTEEVTTLNGGAVSAQHIQRVIQAVRTADGTAVDVTTSGPLPVRGQSTTISPAMTITTAIYAAGDTLAGEVTLANALRESNGTAVLQDLVVIDDDNEKAALTILIFDANPAATAAANAAFAWGSGDEDKVIAKINVAAADYETINAKAIAHKQNLGIVVKGADSSTSLYAHVLVTGAPTYTATSDVQIRYKFLWD